MTVKIEKEIVAWNVINDKKEDTPLPKSEKLESIKPRPDFLHGGTYKIRPPKSENAYYISVTNRRLNNTEKIWEVFINTVDGDDMYWLTALSRSWSAVFRAEDDCSFLVKEIQQIMDSTGGYFACGKHHKSVIAHIGWVLAQHIKGLNSDTTEHIPIKDIDVEATTPKKSSELKEGEFIGDPCKECGEPVFRMKDGCPECQSCFYSKCS